MLNPATFNPKQLLRNGFKYSKYKYTKLPDPENKGEGGGGALEVDHEDPLEDEAALRIPVAANAPNLGRRHQERQTATLTGEAAHGSTMATGGMPTCPLPHPSGIGSAYNPSPSDLISIAGPGSHLRDVPTVPAFSASGYFGDNAGSTGTGSTMGNLHHRHIGINPGHGAIIGESGGMPSPEAESPPGGRARTKPFHCHTLRPGLNKLARNQLTAVSVLCIVFMIGEIIGGTLANSLALITDATHLASDLSGFLVSLFAIWVAARPPTARMSFGYYRAEVLGALVSVLIIWVTTAVLVYLAVRRVMNQDYTIESTSMLITAGAGVGFNIIMGIVLNSSTFGCQAVAHAHSHGHGHSHDHGNSLSHSHSHSQGHGHSHQGHSHQGHSEDHGHAHGQSTSDSLVAKETVENNNLSSHVIQDDVHLTDVCSDEDVTSPWEEEVVRKPKKEVNINVRAAFIHIIGDLIQSIGVFIAALIIKFKPEYKIADPICTFVFSILVLITTITILRDTLMVLLEAVPRGLNYRLCKFDLETLEGVRSVHSLNVWALTMDKKVITVHLAVDPEVDRKNLLERSVLLLREKYNAFQTTIQMEDYDQQTMSTCEDCLGPKLC